MEKLKFEVSFEQQPQQELQLAGFLFYCNGLLLQSQLVKGNMLEFEVGKRSKESAQSDARINVSDLRLFIAPADEKTMASVKSMEDLDRLKPYEPVIKKNAAGMYNILPIPELAIEFWPRCRCRVTGKVSKWFQTGSTWENRAVCRARVHICDVDALRYWIYKIPDIVIAKIPEIVLNPKELIRFPRPLPDPPPFEKFGQLFSNIANTTLFSKSSGEEKIMAKAATLPEFSIEVRQSLASGNLDRIRNSIISNIEIFHPWFCMWPYFWPYFYRLQELAVDYTDAHGRFDATVTYHCFRDKPDIYIWVEYLINGAWEVIYHPPIPCNIRWNYACATPINIQVTDPRVPGNCCCNCHLPGDLVWIRSVGHTSVRHINQDFSIVQPPPGQTVAYNRIGLTDAGAWGDPSYLPTAVGDYKRPFGGSPNLYMGFGSSLPNNSIYYYRWSYHQLRDANLSPVSDSFKAFDALINKGYQFEYIDSNGDTQSAPNNVKLGPFTIGTNDNLYIIPPERPNMAPFNAPETSPDWHEPTDHMLTMAFDSAKLKNGNILGGDGLYEFRLEVFDKSGNLAIVPKQTLKTPVYNDASLSENAPDELLDLASATTASAYKMLMRIENGKCSGEIFKVNVNGAPASLDCCGFVTYKPGGVEADLSLSFEATQPRNFAVFSFSVVKGTCGSVNNAGASGMVIDSADGYTLTSGEYEKHFTPEALLDNCYNNGAGKAAFAETLYVAAMATDGYSRQSGKDAGDAAAFALEPGS